VRAKTRLGIPIKPAKRCPSCVWESFQNLIDDDGVETLAPGPAEESK